MTRPRLLDLFCGAGGASDGYRRAGFDVVGVDLAAQPRYPYEFHKADAMTFPLDGFDAIHASPPCQGFTRARKVGTYKVAPPPPDLIGATRDRLMAAGVPFVIENVEGAPLRMAFKLCGSMFGLKVRRHRLFESSVLMLAPDCQHKSGERPVGVYGSLGDHVQGTCRVTGRYVMGGRTADTIEEAREAMGIPWMLWGELKESIPPAYTAWIGERLIAAVKGSTCEGCGNDDAAQGQTLCTDCMEGP